MSLLFLSSRLLTSPEHIKSSVSGRSISAQSVDVCPEEGGAGEGAERGGRWEVGGGKRGEAKFSGRQPGGSIRASVDHNKTL